MPGLQAALEHLWLPLMSCLDQPSCIKPQAVVSNMSGTFARVGSGAQHCQLCQPGADSRASGCRGANRPGVCSCAAAPPGGRGTCCGAGGTCRCYDTPCLLLTTCMLVSTSRINLRGDSIMIYHEFSITQAQSPTCLTFHFRHIIYFAPSPPPRVVKKVCLRLALEKKMINLED